MKEVDEGFRVGGPAVCGGSDEVWIRAFLEYCRDNGLAPDFVTRHHYTTEVPERVGHYGYPELMRAEDGFRQSAHHQGDYRQLPGIPGKGNPHHGVQYLLYPQCAAA